MEIDADFWPGQSTSKKLLGKSGLHVSFSTAGLHPGIDCVSWEKFPDDDLCGESEGFSE